MAEMLIPLNFPFHRNPTRNHLYVDQAILVQTVIKFMMSALLTIRVKMMVCVDRKDKISYAIVLLATPAIYANIVSVH